MRFEKKLLTNFNSKYFNSTFFQTSRPLDFYPINVNSNQMSARWLKYSVTCTQGNCSLQRVEFVGQPLLNAEG